MKTTHIMAVVTAALLAQTTLLPVLGGGVPIDLVLIAVVFAALSRGSIVGLWTGTVAGLLQDVLSGGIIGVSGLTKTVIGVITGVVGSRFILSSYWHRLAVLVAASFMHAFSYLLVYALIGLDGPVAPVEMIGVQAVVNGVVGVLAQASVRAAPGVLERLRHGRRPKRHRHWIMS